MADTFFDEAYYQLHTLNDKENARKHLKAALKTCKCWRYYKLAMKILLRKAARK